MSLDLALIAMIATAVATGASAILAIRASLRTVVVNIRQRDNGDRALGCYVEQIGGPPIRDLAIRVKVNSEEWRCYRWPSLKKGQAVCVGILMPAGGLRWADGREGDAVGLHSLRIEAEYGRFWRSSSYGGRKELLSVRNGDSWHAAVAGFLWEPPSELDSKVARACEAAAEWFKAENRRRIEDDARRLIAARTDAPDASEAHSRDGHNRGALQG